MTNARRDCDRQPTLSDAEAMRLAGDFIAHARMTWRKTQGFAAPRPSGLRWRRAGALPASMTAWPEMTLIGVCGLAALCGLMIEQIAR